MDFCTIGPVSFMLLSLTVGFKTRLILAAVFEKHSLLVGLVT
jgi:hypothetical protein